MFLGSGGNKRKYINFYALEIHPEALTAIHFLNSMNKLAVWDNLHQVKDVCEFSPPLRLIFKHEQIHSTHLGKAAVRSLQLATDVKEYVIKELWSCVPELLNVHREKKCNQSDRIITIGAGKGGLSYRVSAMDREGGLHSLSCLWIQIRSHFIDLSSITKKNSKDVLMKIFKLAEEGSVYILSLMRV
ncbi:hypothetical protein [Paenibacillus sp. 32352]|uniref:hypothetical protein n=1 Tax=Paenibacillus sp. 32352 TaxID=1969111 RepID=UPI0009AC0EDA|nr:hypothetical protein [Paenibacillus sp. 32352]